MTAPAKTIVQSIELDVIAESELNPRRHFDETKLGELAASIKEKGVLSPVLVRPLPKDQFELVYGHRRARAAKLAGLTEIPAIVRDLDDKQVLEAQVVENLQREDVGPMEEAQAYRSLIDDHGHQVAELAAKVGKSVGYIYRRLKLCELAPAVQEALAEGLVTAAVAELIGRIPDQERQRAALVRVGGDQWNTPVSLKRAQDIIERQFMLDLDTAPFDVKDADLVPVAGSCTTCPKRTGNNPDLFGDVERTDLCTDHVCFGEKRDATWKRKAAAAEEKGQRVLNEKELKKVFTYGTQVAYHSPYVALDDRCSEDPKDRTYRALVGKHATVVLGRDQTGATRELINKSQIPALLKKAGHNFKAARASGSGGGDSYRDEQRKMEQKRKRLQALGAAAMTQMVTHVVDTEPSEAIWRVLAEAALRAAGADALRFIAKRRELVTKGGGWDQMQPLLKSVKQMDVSGLRALIFEALLSSSDTYPNSYQSGHGKLFTAACAAAGVDIKRLQKQLAGEGKAGPVHLATKDIASGRRCGRDGGETTKDFAKVTCGHCKGYGPETFQSLAAKASGKQKKLVESLIADAKKRPKPRRLAQEPAPLYDDEVGDE